VKKAATNFNSIWCLLLKCFSGSYIKEFLISHVGAGDYGLVLELLEVLGHLVLDVAKVLLLSRHDSLIGLLQQLTNFLP
jgi:hypothetical protein